jgi:hypothetical protein
MSTSPAALRWLREGENNSELTTQQWQHDAHTGRERTELKIKPKSFCTDQGQRFMRPSFSKRFGGWRMLLKSGGGSFSMVSGLALSPPQHPDRRDQTKPLLKQLLSWILRYFRSTQRRREEFPDISTPSRTTDEEWTLSEITEQDRPAQDPTQ